MIRFHSEEIKYIEHYLKVRPNVQLILDQLAMVGREAYIDSFAYGVSKKLNLQIDQVYRGIYWLIEKGIVSDEEGASNYPDAIILHLKYDQFVRNLKVTV